MKLSTFIICLIASLSAISCTKTPDCREFLAPEIVSITSLPEINKALLVSDLKHYIDKSTEAGFYIGKDKTNLMRCQAEVYGQRFRLEVLNLEENTTYYFKAYVTNGLNEIASGFESFKTETMPEQPSEPEVPEQPENPGPDEPETPEEPSVPDEPETPDTPEMPEDPSEPVNPSEPEPPQEPGEPAEFTVEISNLSTHYGNDILELTAELEGDASLITDCWFMVGVNPDKLTRIKGAIEGNSVKAYLVGLGEGTYHYKAVITNGVETKESDTCQIVIYPN